MRTLTHDVDLCVVGGGMSGLCAAIAAARHGISVALIHDRPVLGGNASSEIRMWVSGAHGKDHRETGIIEEILLENEYLNRNSVYSIWDAVLYEKAAFQPNLKLILNASVNHATMNGGSIQSVKAWQLTSETWHVVNATIFADCSGDSILAPLTQAEFRIGREARAEFDEDIEPEEADRKTMGMSCLIQMRETPTPQPFTPPAWATKFEREEDLPREHAIGGFNNFWWLELGGEEDTVHDAEEIRDRLLPLAFGVWDHIKNHCDHRADNWILDWVGFLPGKRESRRYVGDHILTQNEVRAEGKFADIIAYGGWSMDDHNPAGFNYPGYPTIFHPAPSPFGIPYRCLYSVNVPNLMFAGRNISVTHAAMSSSRVMGTCALLGQALGTAAAIAVKQNLTPRQVGQKEIAQLQQQLMEDDCWLPGHKRQVPELTMNATLTASEQNPETLRNGCDRPEYGDENEWSCQKGGWVQLDFNTPRTLTGARIVFDGNLNRQGVNAARNTVSNFPLNLPDRVPPQTLVKNYRLELKDENGTWKTVRHDETAHQRLVTIPLEDTVATAVRLTLLDTWGDERCRVFSFDVR